MGELGDPAHKQSLERERSKAGTIMHASGLTSRGETERTRLWCPIALGPKCELRLLERLGHPFFQSTTSILQGSSICQVLGGDEEVIL